MAEIYRPCSVCKKPYKWCQFKTEENECRNPIANENCEQEED